jgi:hypothetical protein
MKKSIYSLAVFFATIFWVSGVFAATWYVDNAASGSNNGKTWSDAWESFADISWGSVSAGDIIYISGGATSKTYSGTLDIRASGTPGNPIKVKVGQDSGHTGTVILDGGGSYGINTNGEIWVTISGQLGSGTTPNMIIRNHSADEIRLSSITGVDIGYLDVGPNNSDECIHVVNGYLGGSNRIHHNKIHGCYDYHIWVGPAGSTEAGVVADIVNDDHLRIDHNDIYDLGHDGIHTSARTGGITIDHNDVHTAASGANQHPVYIDGMHLRGGHYLTVSNNKIYNLEGPDGMWAYIYFEIDSIQSNIAANDIYIYNNIIYETDQSYSDMNVGIVFACKYCASLTRVRILNNVIVDTEHRGMSFGANNAVVSDVIIANNLIYNSALDEIGGNRSVIAINYLDAPGGVTTGSFGDTPIPDIIWDYNLVDINGSDRIVGRYGSGSGTMYTYDPDWKSVSGGDDNGVTSDPTFVNWTEGNAVDLHLAESDTAAINRGIDISSLSALIPDIIYDIDGNLRGADGAWDIGAYEYSNDTLAPNPPTNLTIN